MESMVKHLQVESGADHGGKTSNIMDSEIAKYLYLDFDFGSAGDLAAGFAFQIVNDLFLYNGQDCVFWAFDAFSDFMNGFLILTEEERPLEAVMSFSFAIHKGPVAYYTCHKTVNDYQLIVTFYNTFALTSADTWGTEVIKIIWNVFFNLVDLMYEIEFLEEANQEREWTTIGEYLAKILSDVFFKSPVTGSWNYKNSDALNEEWVEPLNIKDGAIKTINFVLEKLGQPLINEEHVDQQAEEDLNSSDETPFVMSSQPKIEVNDSNRVKAI